MANRELADRAIEVQLAMRGLVAGGRAGGRAGGGVAYSAQEVAASSADPWGRGGGGPRAGENGGDVHWSVDVVRGELGGDWVADGARAYVASARLFHLPEDAVVVIEESGDLACCAAKGGQLVHRHRLGRRGDVTTAGVAADLRSTLLALESAGVAGPFRSVELWGDFGGAEVEALARGVGMPVEASPVPSPGAVPDLGATPILPAAVVAGRTRQRWRVWKLLAAAIAVGAYCLTVVELVNRVRRTEAKAEALEAEVAATAGPAEVVKAAGARWNAMRNVIDPRRYPLVHLDHISRVMPEGGVVMRRFDSKVSEVVFAGAARGAKQAYEFFNALTADEALKVYSWSMERPAIKPDGSAEFEVKGKLR